METAKAPASTAPASTAPTSAGKLSPIGPIMLRLRRKAKRAEVESRWPETPDEKPFHGEGARPGTVAAGALCAYILAAAYLAQGAGEPLGSGTGASGLAFIILGVLVLGFTTLAIQGSKLGRACLTIPLVIGSAVVVNDGGQPAWIRVGSVLLSAATITFLMLEPRARVFFGDDDSPLLPHTDTDSE